jgi:hypothetical protein
LFKKQQQRHIMWVFSVVGLVRNSGNEKRVASAARVHFGRGSPLAEKIPSALIFLKALLNWPHIIWRFKNRAQQMRRPVWKMICASRGAIQIISLLARDFSQMICSLDFLILLHQGKRMEFR